MLTESMVPSALAHWRDYAELCKPRVVGLIVFTAVIGMFLATPGAVPLAILIPATLGIGLAAASAAAINHVAEHRIDALMARTKNRPLPQGGLSRTQALVFALLIGALAMYLLVEVNRALLFVGGVSPHYIVLLDVKKYALEK